MRFAVKTRVVFPVYETETTKNVGQEFVKQYVNWDFFLFSSL